jgi:hypothetical protein
MAAHAATPVEILLEILAQKYPEARWSYATMGVYKQPLAEAACGLSPAETGVLEKSSRD